MAHGQKLTTNMGFKESLKAEFTALLSGDLLSVDVPGIDGKVWFRPLKAMNPIQKDKWTAAVSKGTAEGTAEVLILMARNEDGTKMYKSSELEELRLSVSAKTIDTIVAAMIREGGKSLVDPK